MPLQETSGTASYDAFGGGAAVEPVYIEQIFSTWLYTGNASTQTITNGIDLAGKGGLVWIKNRNGTADHFLQDTSRGVNNYLNSNNTSAAGTLAGINFSFNSNGFSQNNAYAAFNANSGGQTYTSWTFRKQPKFFDVVTYTGNGTTDGTQVISHNLGSTPGCIIIKRTDSASDWFVYHRGTPGGGTPSGANSVLRLNTTAARTSITFTSWGVTSTTFRPFSISGSPDANVYGGTYVAYLFAHDAGGFGLTGTDNVISCGSFTTDGSGNATVNLGYEPQYVMYKSASTAGAWQIFDSMRGLTMGADNTLSANASTAEGTGTDWLTPSATGFSTVGASFYTSATYIYIAIRRGPMKTPTSGTSVLGLSARTGTGANATVTGGAGVTDLAIIKNRGSVTNWVWTPRLADTGYLSSNATTAETAAVATILQANPWDVMDGVKVGTTSNLTNASGNTFANYLLDRAPGFMDVVCYTGTGVARTVNHNLGVAPQLIICKPRSATGNWYVGGFNDYAAGWDAGPLLNSDAAGFAWSGVGIFNNTAPTSSVFSLGNSTSVNASGSTYVAYLFASCPGVSKVGSYSGTGATQTISCGFAARFVMIKRTDSTGNWFVWDTARGMVAGTDPRLALNSTAAEANNNWVYTDASGFQIVTTDATVNASGGSYIYLAIA